MEVKVFNRLLSRYIFTGVLQQQLQACNNRVITDEKIFFYTYDLSSTWAGSHLVRNSSKDSLRWHAKKSYLQQASADLHLTSEYTLDEK